MLTPEALLNTPRVSAGELNQHGVVSHCVKQLDLGDDSATSVLCLSDASAWSTNTKQVSSAASSISGPGVWSSDGVELFFLQSSGPSPAQVHVLPQQGAPYAVSNLPGGISEISSIESSVLASALPFHQVQMLLASVEVYDRVQPVSVHPGSRETSSCPTSLDSASPLQQCSGAEILEHSKKCQSEISQRKSKAENWVALDAAPARHWDTTDAYRTRTHTLLLVLTSFRTGAGGTNAGAGSTSHMHAQGVFKQGQWQVAAAVQLTGALQRQDCPQKPWGGLAESVNAYISKTRSPPKSAQVLDEWVLDVAAVFRNTGLTSGHNMMATTAAGVHRTRVPLGAVLREFAETLPAHPHALQCAPAPCTDVTHRWIGEWELLSANRPTFHSSPVFLSTSTANADTMQGSDMASVFPTTRTAQGGFADAAAGPKVQAAAPAADLLLWTAMERPGYESDSMRLVVFHVASGAVLYRGTDVDVSLGRLHPLGTTAGPAGETRTWVLCTAAMHGVTRGIMACISIQRTSSGKPVAAVSYHWLALPGSVDSFSARVKSADETTVNSLPESLDVRLVFRSCSMQSPHELLSATLRCPPDTLDVTPPCPHPAQHQVKQEHLSSFSIDAQGVCLAADELQLLCPGGVPSTQQGGGPAAAWPYGVPAHALPEVDVPLVDAVTRVCEAHCSTFTLGQQHSVWFVGGNNAGRRGPSGEWLSPDFPPGHNEWGDELMGADVRQLDREGTQVGDAVQAWVLTPPGVTRDAPPSTPLPVVVLVHGGPQGAWGDSWHYRWHPQSYAAAGFVVLAVNFHGSSSCGQAFQDAVTGDWGGAPQLDNMLGLRWLLHASPWAGVVDGERVAAAGASFGGYSVNWLNGHTRLLKGVVCHDGIFDSAAAAFTTEETWFMQWEFGGLPGQQGGAATAAETARREGYAAQGLGGPCAFPPLAPAAQVAALYAQWSPSTHCGEWATPTLVIHGGKDFRLPETDGVAAFNALQRNGVPSRLLYFPDENHWVLRSANSAQWHKQVMAWLTKWTAANPACEAQ